MDAVELPLPAAVAMSKLLTGEGVGRTKATMEEEEIREPDRVSILGSPSSTGCSSSTGRKEKSRVIKQKHSLDGKRGDRRNSKAAMKTKFDSFFSKAGFIGSNSAAGGNNLLGIYGLKSDIHDITKHVDELSLNELFDDNYKCPSLCQDKGKKATNTSENILNLVRKACSILQFQRHAQSQNVVDIDSNNRKTSPWPLSSESCVKNSVDCDKGDNFTTDLASSSKDSIKPGAPINANSSQLYELKDMLGRLALPPAKDLDSLLLDTVKSAVSSRNISDLRSGKPTSNRSSLPSFSWSHSLSGSCRTNIDPGKMSTNRSTCQSRWVRMGNAASSPGVALAFADLDSLPYDDSLVPSGGKEFVHESEKSLSVHVNSSLCEPLSSTVACHLPEAEGDLKCQGNCAVLMGSPVNAMPVQETEVDFVEMEQSERTDAGHSPRVISAAQTLYEIATHSWKQKEGKEGDGKVRWPKRPSTKAMKAPKPGASTGKTESVSVTAKPETGHGCITDQTTTSKRPRLHTKDERKDVSPKKGLARGMIKWSTPTSSKSSLNKFEQESVTDTKLLNSDPIRLLGTLPSPARMLDKAYNGQQKSRMTLAMDWGRGKSKKE
ncbi:PREDICTED: uncharacterized protein LOC104600240 isoform X2 [Nelumbo nucifera]|uniref:Uncharacterized protein LOC104600240 isoform X2 n=1 Tax=Nelumbo nucifera TaxID=4432 RepID=A0A1U8A4S4_NELNU|nr:PREDICTED: uncharacterized protein LOC104600240 isoform X2 [Nelumbo nucifera]